jgi:hypothetical protein
VRGEGEYTGVSYMKAYTSQACCDPSGNTMLQLFLLLIVGVLVPPVLLQVRRFQMSSLLQKNGLRFFIVF